MSISDRSGTSRVVIQVVQICGGLDFKLFDLGSFRISSGLGFGSLGFWIVPGRVWINLTF
jgi:hypothetical protein